MDCKECIFADYHNNVQVGCKAERLDKFIENNTAKLDKTNKYYDLTKFCNLYRTQSWVDDSKAEINDLQRARSEVMPLFGVVVRHSNKNSIEELKKTIDSILDIAYPPEKIKVVISSPQIHFNEIVHFVNVLKDKFKSSESIFHFADDAYTKDTESFKKIIKSTYFVSTESGETIERNLFSYIDKTINDDLNQVCMIDSGNTTIILKKIMLDTYLNFNDYDLASDHIRALCIEQNKYEKIR
jgi:hypothetical protein